MKPITWREAEDALGYKVDRRFKYAKRDDGQPCDVSGCVVFHLIKWTESCSGCYESVDGYNPGYPIHPKHGCPVGSGCEWCGYHGVSRRSWWAPYSKELQAIEKEEF